MKTKILFCFLFVNVFTFFAQMNCISSAQSPNDMKKTEIRKLLVKNGNLEAAVAIVNIIYDDLKTKYPQAPQRFWASMEEVLNPIILLETQVDIYHKTFTQSEVSELLYFYESPLGSKMAYISPQLSVASMRETNAWLTQVTQIIQKRLKEQGMR